MNTTHVFAFLDKPTRFLLWTIDEIIVMMIPFLIGILMGSFFVIGLGIVIYRVYCTYKKRYSAGIIKAFVYWYFPGKFSWIPPSHQRCLVG